MISTYKELEPAKMLQGSSIEMRCSFVDEVNNTKIPADISEYDCWFVLYPYSQEDYAQFIKKCSLVTGTSHTMSVYLLSEETKNWQGGYTFEFVLKDLNGEFIKNSRGVLTVLKSNVNTI